MTTTNSFNMNLLNTASALEQVGQLLQNSHLDPPESIKLLKTKMVMGFMP